MRRTTRVTVAAMAVSLLALAACGRSGATPAGRRPAPHPWPPPT